MRQPLYHLISCSGFRRVCIDLHAETLFAQDGIALTVEWVGHSRRDKQLALLLLMPAFVTCRYGAANRSKSFPS
jgi:hypothetical protein